MIFYIKRFRKIYGWIDNGTNTEKFFFILKGLQQKVSNASLKEKA